MRTSAIVSITLITVTSIASFTKFGGGVGPQHNALNVRDRWAAMEAALNKNWNALRRKSALHL